MNPGAQVRSLSNAELNIKGYNLFCNDRLSSPDDGVLLYIHDSLPAVSYKTFMDYDFKESVWCLVTLEGGIKQLIGVMYRSPSSTDENNQKLLSMIRKSSQLHCPVINNNNK